VAPWRATLIGPVGSKAVGGGSEGDAVGLAVSPGGAEVGGGAEAVADGPTVGLGDGLALAVGALTVGAIVGDGEGAAPPQLASTSKKLATVARAARVVKCPSSTAR
jgi:hypothetical protein